MAESNPTIRRAGLPSEAQPNNAFPVEVEIRQGGPDPWASDGYCVASNLDVRGWTTPVELLVDGEVVDETELCIVSGNTKTTTLRAAVGSGAHTLRVRVYRVGGDAYDLEPPIREVNDERSGTISGDTEARDPSEPTSSDRALQFLGDVADALGTSVNMVALGILVATGVFLFI